MCILSSPGYRDRRTYGPVHSLLHGNTRPHARTLHNLAEGLGVETDELFQDVFQSGATDFDRATNPLVAEVIHARPNLFDRWTQADFDELFSRMGVGGS